jgi:hypothetical protein
MRTLVQLLCQLTGRLPTKHITDKGSSSAEYDKLYQQVEQIKRRVGEIATEFLDTSFESRFLAVKVLDSNLDESTRNHFIQRAQASFWTVYQQLRGWRIFLVGILQELGR